jgi:hypothetical protein
VSHPSLGELLAGDAASTRHLAGCPECRRLLELAGETEEGPRYERGEVAHVGGMGRTVRAVDRTLGREVLLKEARSGIGGSASLAQARLEREARLTARLVHPAIVPVYDLGRGDDGQPFYAMPWVEGRTLAEVILDTAPGARLGLVREVAAVADALAFAHSRGVVHRDIKPENILIGRYGQVVVIDWGLAAEVDRRDLGGVGPAVPGPWTRVGVGTPAYMAPEQAQGASADPRQDVYALGATLYHALAGVPPWGTSGPATIRAGIRDEARPPPLVHLAPTTPPALLSLIERAMDPDPAGRFGSAEALAADLRAWLDGRLLASHRYSTSELAMRWVWARRGALSVLGAAALAALAVGGASLREVLSARDVAIVALEDALGAQARLLAADRTQTAAAARVAVEAYRVAKESGRAPHPRTEAALRAAWRAGPAARKVPGTAGWAPRQETPSGLILTDPTAGVLRVRADGVEVAKVPAGHPMGLAADAEGGRWLAMYREGFGVFGRRVGGVDRVGEAFPLPGDGIRAHLLPEGAAILGDHQVSAVDESGRVRWTVAWPVATGAISGTTTEVWVGDTAGAVSRLRASDGGALPPLATGLGPVRSLRALPDGRALAGLADGGVFLLEGGVPREVARLGHAIDVLVASGPCASATAGESGVAVIALGHGCTARSWPNVRGGALRADGGAVLVVERARACAISTLDGRRLACISASSADLGGGFLDDRAAYLMGLAGVLVWDTQAGSPQATSEIVAVTADGWVASRDGGVTRVDLASGSAREVVRLAGGISAAAPWNGGLVAGGFDGEVVAVAADGVVVRTRVAGAVGAWAPAEDGVWMGTYDGDLTLLDARLSPVRGWRVPGGVRGVMLADHGPVTWGTDGLARRWSWRGTALGAVGTYYRPVSAVVTGKRGETWVGLPQGATRWRADGGLEPPLSGRLLGIATDGRIATSFADGRVAVYSPSGHQLAAWTLGSRAPRALVGDLVVADDGELWTLDGASLGVAPAPWTAAAVVGGWRLAGDLEGRVAAEPLDLADLVRAACARARAVGEGCGGG